MAPEALLEDTSRHSKTHHRTKQASVAPLTTYCSKEASISGGFWCQGLLCDVFSRGSRVARQAWLVWHSTQNSRVCTLFLFCTLRDALQAGTTIFRDVLVSVVYFVIDLVSSGVNGAHARRGTRRCESRAWAPAVPPGPRRAREGGLHGDPGRPERLSYSQPPQPTPF